MQLCYVDDVPQLLMFSCPCHVVLSAALAMHVCSFGLWLPDDVALARLLSVPSCNFDVANVSNE